MCQYVNLNISWNCKLLLTYITFVILLTNMTKYMPSESLQMTKYIFTDVTLIWFFSCVYAFVHIEIPSLRKLFPTDVTLVWLLTCLFQYVCLETSSIREWFLADVTFASHLASEKCYPQTSHLCGFSPMCFNMCCLRPSVLENCFVQKLHLCGFSPVWLNMCRLTFTASKMLHLYGFSCVA